MTLAMNKEWAPLAWEAVLAGPPALRQLLKDRTPRSDQVFRDLLQYIDREYNGDQNDANELYKVVFEALKPEEGTYRYQLQRSDEERSPQDRRKRPWVAQDLSAYDVFRVSMLDNTSRPAPAHSPLTQLIWDYAKEELYCQGAISACAEFGLDDLLIMVLAELKKRHTERQEQLEILFQIPHNSPFTALGAAIANRKTKCFNTLYLSIHGAADHIFTAPNVVTKADTEVRLVHWALRQITARQTQTGNFDVLEEEEELLRRIITVEPRLLAQHDSDGLTPYALALEIQRSIHTGDGNPEYQELGSIIRNAIFEQLKDPEDWSRALYCRSGEINLLQPLPRC
jgi:hypothetical protein